MITEHPAFVKRLAEQPALAACYHAAREALEKHFRGRPEALPRALGIFVLGVLAETEVDVAALREAHHIPKRREDNSGFACIACGNCCRPSGYVRLQENEAERIAEFLNVELDAFIQTQTRVTDDRRHLSLPEGADGVCDFLTPCNLCRIHSVKPEQCRGYPWRWRSDVLDPICAGRCAMAL